MPRLVGNPFFVHRVVYARQDADHLASARVDPDRRAERVLHVDALGLLIFPGPRTKILRLRQQRADGAEVRDIALKLRRHGALEICGDLHVLAAPDRAHFSGAGDFRRKADAARAMDAAGHLGLD